MGMNFKRKLPIPMDIKELKNLISSIKELTSVSLELSDKKDKMVGGIVVLPEVNIDGWYHDSVSDIKIKVKFGTANKIFNVERTLPNIYEVFQTELKKKIKEVFDTDKIVVYGNKNLCYNKRKGGIKWLINL